MKKTLVYKVAAVLTMLALALVISFVPGTALAALDDVTISHSGSDTTLAVGETMVLTGLMDLATNVTYVWSISSGSSVTLSSPNTNQQNTVTAAAVGTTVVQLSATDTDTSTTKTATISIDVAAFNVVESSVTILPSSTSTLTPQNYTGSISWSTGSSAVATVNSSGVVTAVAGGNTTITATNTVGSVTQTDTTTVYVPAATLSPASQTLTSGNAPTSLSLTVTNGGSLISTPGATVNWSTSDGTIGVLSASTSTVNASGVATIGFTSSAGGTNGMTTITASVGGISRTATITVTTSKYLDIVGPSSLSNSSRTGTYTVYLKNPDGTVYDDDTSTVHWSWSSSYLSLTSDSINSSRDDMHNGEAHIQLYARYNTPSSGTRLYAWINDDSGNRVYHTITITGLSSLPQTGQDMTLVYVFGGLGAALLAAAGVWYGIRKKRTAA